MKSAKVVTILYVKFIKVTLVASFSVDTGTVIKNKLRSPTLLLHGALVLGCIRDGSRCMEIYISAQQPTLRAYKRGDYGQFYHTDNRSRIFFSFFL